MAVDGGALDVLDLFSSGDETDAATLVAPRNGALLRTADIAVTGMAGARGAASAGRD